jgi:hypothetical protein
MARLLLKLGATCSQAESNGVTALHRYITTANSSLIDVLLESDKVALKSAVNHLFLRGYYWDAETISPLHSAVVLDNPELVRKLLSAGALAHVDFETWLKAARLNENYSRRLGTLETNKERYNQSLEQPLITAIRQGYFQVAIELLENGADANTLTLETQKMLHNTYERQYNKGRSALDLVRDLITKLSEYKGEQQMVEPMETPGVDTYLQKFKPGTYQHWIVEKKVSANQESFKKSMESYHENVKRIQTLAGVPEKLEAINETVSGFKSLESVLLAKDAKPFAELQPDIKTKETDNLMGYNNSTTSEREPPKPFEYNFRFTNDKDMTETRREGYIQL